MTAYDSLRLYGNKNLCQSAIITDSLGHVYCLEVITRSSLTNRIRPVAMALHGVANAWATGCHHFATPENFPAIFYGCFIIVAKERYPNILVEINLGLSTIQKYSIFSCMHFIYFIVIT